MSSQILADFTIEMISYEIRHLLKRSCDLAENFIYSSLFSNKDWWNKYEIVALSLREKFSWGLTYFDKCAVYILLLVL